MENLKSRINDIINISKEELYPPLPKKNLLIEVCNFCNYKCIFCANRKMTRKKGYIDSKLLSKILIDAYDLGVREVGFYTTGEPFLNSKLEEYIKMAKDIGYSYIYLTTNGYLASIDKTRKLIGAGLNSIKFSINAINSKDYIFIHGIDGYDKVIKNLTDIYNYKKSSNINFNVYVSYVATRYTNYGNNKIIDNFLGICDDVMVVNCRNQSGMVPEIDNLLSCNTNNEGRIPAQRILPCHYTFNAIIVTCEGYLTACCTDFQNYLAYADLNKTTIKKAWHNRTITELRRKQLKNNLEGTLCFNCINSSKKLPKPLNNKLCSPMKKDMLSSCKYVKERIKEYYNNTN